MLRDQGFDLGRLQPVIFLLAIWQIGEPFPPVHAGNGWALARQIERDLNAAMLNFPGMRAAHFEGPRFGRRPCAHVVTDFDKEKFLVPMRLGVSAQLSAFPFPRLGDLVPGRIFTFR